MEQNRFMTEALLAHMERPQNIVQEIELDLLRKQLLWFFFIFFDQRIL